MLNSVTIMGRITHDLNLEQGANTQRLGFRIACDRDFSKGEKKADFLACAAFGKTAEFIAKFFGKGKPILIQGRLQTDEWTGKDGSKRSDTKIIVLNAHFCESRSSASTAASTSAPTPTPIGQAKFSTIDEADSDLPF